MKKVLAIMLIAVLVLGVAALVGCGDGKEEVKVKTEEGDVEVDTEQGDIEFDTKAPSEKELGIPVYPGAKAVEGASGTVSEGESSFSARQYVTDDSVSQVVEWYRGELSGESQFMDMSTAEGGMISYQSGDEIKTVTVTPGTGELQGKTVFILSITAGEMPTLPQ